MNEEKKNIGRPKWTPDDLRILEEDPAEAAHRRSEEAEKGKSRRRIEEADAVHKRCRESFRLLLMAGVVAGIAYAAIRLITFPAATADDRRWGTTVLGSTVTGFLAYLAGLSKGPLGPAPP